MGLSARQTALCDRWAWPCTPSTARTAYGTPSDDTAALPSTSRRAGPYRAHFTDGRDLNRRPGGDASNPAGTLILATTATPAGTITSVIISTSTTPTAGRCWPVAGVRSYNNAAGHHHTTLTLGSPR